ncbi:alpha/beta hydrolase [Leifsonia shinshuensis]|uniref:alpha/beta hydrolase n=1 Tax=Leifsonia shinshuensis TaxID=150026 RepID=UPI001F506390|nr:alpha/beta hydrolase [Leifsonia shinshuensis]MCI0158758.1 alpha/beta hydrolase [Leifsonia shinshuensis]
MDDNARFLDAVSRLPAPAMDDRVAAARERRVLLAELFDSPGDAVVEQREEVIAGVSVRIFEAAGADGRDAAPLVYVHGGGWVAGDPRTHAGICARLARQAGRTVVSVDYRRPPEHRHPAAVHDVIAVLDALPAVAALAGDSSGAHVAFEAAVHRAARPGVRPIDRLVLIQPACDPAMDRPSWAAFGSGRFLTAAAMRWYWDEYAGPESAGVLPLWEHDLAGLPPALIILGALDPLLDEGAELARRLRDAGVAVDVVVQPDALHGSLTMPAAFPAHAGAFTTIAAWIAGGAQRGSTPQKEGITA